MRVAEISGHAARPRRLAQRTLVRHAAVAFLATGLVLGFASVHIDFSPMHRWNRAFGDASVVLVALSVGLGPLARFLRSIVRVLPFRRELGIYACPLAIVHAAVILIGWVEWDLMRLAPGEEFDADAALEAQVAGAIAAEPSAGGASYK